MSTVSRLLGEAEGLGAVSDSPALDAELLLAHCLQRPHSWLFAHPEAEVSATARWRYAALLRRRQRGEPVAWLRGYRAFRQLSLRSDRRALVPRPESELLVEWALEAIPAGQRALVADLGTGSGALALALAAERPGWRIVAVDRCRQALSLARENRDRLALSNVHLLAQDWCAALAEARFDLIVSNPPYVAENDPVLRSPELCHEPLSALAAAEEGRAELRRIAATAGSCLKPGGRLILEHGSQQAAFVRARLRAAGFGRVRSHRDLAGLQRASSGSFEGCR